MKSVWVDQVPYRSVSDEPHGYYHVILQRCSVSNRATSTDVLFDFFFFQTYMFIPVSYTHLTLPTNREV